MTSDEERCASLSLLRGARVTTTIKKRIKNDYVNFTVSQLEVLGGAFSLYEEDKANAAGTSNTSETMNDSVEKVQQWLD